MPPPDSEQMQSDTLGRPGVVLLGLSEDGQHSILLFEIFEIVTDCAYQFRGFGQ